MNRKQQSDLYRAEMGDEAWARNLIDASNRYPCCFGYHDEGHHPNCRNHPAVRAAKNYRKHFGDATLGA